MQIYLDEIQARAKRQRNAEEEKTGAKRAQAPKAPKVPKAMVTIKDDPQTINEGWQKVEGRFNHDKEEKDLDQELSHDDDSSSDD
jgi:hypothetical protein